MGIVGCVVDRSRGCVVDRSRGCVVDRSRGCVVDRSRGCVVEGMCCRSKGCVVEGMCCRSKGCVVVVKGGIGEERSCMPKKGREELYAEMLSIKARDVLSIKGFVCRKRAERSCMPKKGHKSIRVVVLEEVKKRT
jgi:hypothetical protein